MRWCNPRRVIPKAFVNDPRRNQNKHWIQHVNWYHFKICCPTLQPWKITSIKICQSCFNWYSTPNRKHEPPTMKSLRLNFDYWSTTIVNRQSIRWFHAFLTYTTRAHVIKTFFFNNVTGKENVLVIHMFVRTTSSKFKECANLELNSWFD